MSRLAVSVVALLSACVVNPNGGGTDDPILPGTVEVSWQVGPSGCDAAGVSSIEIDVDGITSSFACADLRGSMSVPAGRHDVAMYGLDADGVARYAGEALNVTVRSEQTVQVPTVILSALPAELYVSWYFDNGKLCSSAENNGVTDIEAILYQDDFVESSVSASCDEGELLIEDVRPGTYTLSLIGRNDAQGITHQGEAVLEVEKGDQLSVDVELVTQ
ncbi:MAG: hypothetical protein R3F59_04900 [Myxococcota bacterium]